MKRTELLRSLAALAFVATILTAVAAAKDDNSAVAPVSRPDAWWQTRHQGMNERVKKGNVDMLFIGDSITHGWEGGGKDVWKKYYEPRNAVNLGIGGDQTQHVLWRLEHGNIAGVAPKLAVLMIGTNNAGSNSPPQTTAGVKAIVDILRQKLPETKVLVLAVFPRGADNQDHLRQVNAKVNESISNLADSRMVFYLDIGPKFLEADGRLSKEIMPDLLHPNAKGYAIWAEAIEPTVVKLMSEEGSCQEQCRHHGRLHRCRRVRR
jgi:lysophospholipase L1-like esterase